MLDYRRWIDRAVAYINGPLSLARRFQISGSVQPPLDDADVDRLAKQCRLPIPGSLRRFWTTGTSGADLCYHWEPVPTQFAHQVRMASDDRFDQHLWGGLEILSAEDLTGLSHEMPSWAEGMTPEHPKDARIWEHSLPLIPVGDGDYVGLYVRDDPVDPPVVYMCHEGSGGSDVLSSNLDEFLQGWEQLRYIGIDFLVTYCHRDTGRLAVESHLAKCEALQALLRGEVRTDLVQPPPVASEQDWLSAQNPRRMLDWLEQQGLDDKRKLRLYCCACCQRVGDHMGDSGRRAVDVSRRYADGLATEEELAAARLALSGGTKPSLNIQSLTQLKERNIGSLTRFQESIDAMTKFRQQEGLMPDVAYAAVDAYPWVSSEITQHLDDPQCGAESAAHADLVRHIFGNPFRPSANRAAHPAAIKRLAQQLYDGQAVSRALRAALLDAGESELAEHFGFSDHPRGCWALDQILGK